MANLYGSPYGYRYGSPYGASSSQSSTSLQSRCANLKITNNSGSSSSDININASKMDNFKVPKNLKSTINNIKKQKTRIQYPKGKNNKSRQNNRTNATKTLDAMRQSYYRDLASFLKTKAISRITKLINSPKDSRLEKVACTLKALFETIGKCPSRTTTTNSYQYGRTSMSSVNSIESFKRQFQDKFKSDTNMQASASQFLNNILQNISGSVEYIKKSQHKNEFRDKMIEILNTVPTC